MKKRGFTLVELMCAIAIIGIVMTAVTPAFSLAINVWYSGRVKLNTSSYAQAICENYKLLGKQKLKKIYNGTEGKIGINSKQTVTDYIYFNNVDDIELAIESKNSFENIAADENYDSCKNKKTADKRYGALLEIFKDNKTTNIEIYAIRIIVWDLNTNKSSTVREMYLGR